MSGRAATVRQCLLHPSSTHLAVRLLVFVCMNSALDDKLWGENMLRTLIKMYGIGLFSSKWTTWTATLINEDQDIYRVSREEMSRLHNLIVGAILSKKRCVNMGLIRNGNREMKVSEFG
jgi:hypothetical protein